LRSSAVVALATGCVLGFVLANDLPLASISPSALAAISALIAMPSAIVGVWLLLSLEPANCFGFWRGVFSTLIAWPTFCLVLSITLQLLHIPPGWVYGGGVFLLGSIFILPLLLLFGGSIGWLVGYRSAT
jgi:hypothetical protein